MTLRYVQVAAGPLLLAAACAASAQQASAQTTDLPPAQDMLAHIPALTTPARTWAQAHSLLYAPRQTVTLEDGTKSQLSLAPPQQTTKNCLTLRSYNYAPGSSNPQFTGSTTCTLAKTDGARYAIAPQTR